jgi:hypothetical protein
MTVEERLASIDTTLTYLGERLKEQSQQMSDIDAKVDSLNWAEAARSGAAESNKRHAGIFGGGVAASIVGIVEGIRFLVGR